VAENMNGNKSAVNSFYFTDKELRLLNHLIRASK